MGEIPERCTRIERLDEKLEFCKLNCKWGVGKRGPPVGSQRQKILSCSKKQEGVSVSIRLEKSMIARLKRKSFEISLSEHRSVSVSQLVREAIMEKFPENEQLDMFG